jgi:hypothetical protein
MGDMPTEAQKLPLSYYTGVLTSYVSELSEHIVFRKVIFILELFKLTNPLYKENELFHL